MQVIWGMGDRFLKVGDGGPAGAVGPEGAGGPGGGASHFVQMDEPERVNQLLVEFLSGA